MTAPLRVSLAAKFDRRAEMQAISKWLRSLGYVVVSRWPDSTKDDSSLTDAEAIEAALMDEHDIKYSDVLVAFAERRGTPGADRGGRHAEVGGAIFLGKPVILVGVPEHVFHRHPLVTVVCSRTAMAQKLLALAEERDLEARRETENGTRA
jgi:hypothetical protein